MSAIEKIIEQLPYGDGAIRRRFIAGLIFVLLLIIHYYAIHLPQGDPVLKMSDLSQLVGFEPRDLLNNTQALIVAAIIVFVIGSILDAMIEGFIVRGVSITLAALNWLFSRAKLWPPIFRGIWMAFIILCSFFIWPLAIIVCTVLNSAGFNKLYRIGLTEHGRNLLSDDAANFYRSQLPVGIRTGLDELFGDQSGSAWQRLMDFVPEPHRPWVSRLNARNHDLASFIASAMLSLIISGAVNYVLIYQVPYMFFITYCVICFLSYLFFGCATIVRRSTVSVLELVAATKVSDMNKLLRWLRG